MNKTKEDVLFLGNGSYLNRGCEAIVIGTIQAFSEVLQNELTVSNGCFIAEQAVLDAQVKREKDARLTHFSLLDHRLNVEYPRRFSVDWIKRQLGLLFGTTAKVITPYRDLLENFPHPNFALQIGGDNYTLDYGKPIQFLEVDQELISAKVPLFLWAASVGPFNEDPEFEERMAQHLSKFSAIFVREEISRNYLSSIGVKAPIKRMDDPAFLMASTMPRDPALQRISDSSFIGLNVSPLISKFRPHGSLEEWTGEAVRIVQELLVRFDDSIALIPHVTVSLGDQVLSCNTLNADEQLLRDIFERLSADDRKRVLLVGNDLSAQELKWVISECRLFIGARTHSTIAAFSSRVPTVSIAYSEKARGINESLFGHERYCVDAKSLSVESLVSVVEAVHTDSDAIRTTLNERIPEFQERAIAAARSVVETCNISTK